MKLKQKYKIGKVLSLATLMAIANACTKDPVPNPTPTPTPEPIPTDTVQPIIPTKEIVIDWDWHSGLGLAPSKDTIEYYTLQDSVKYVFIDFKEMNVTNLSPANFHRARDSLQTRIAIDTNKVRGSGTLYVNSANGAHLPDCTDHNILGMALVDSIWYTTNGWNVRRLSL